MPKYVLTRQYLVPVYQHLEIEADTVEDACQKAIDYDHWDTQETDYDSARDTTIEAIAEVGDDDDEIEPFVTSPYDYDDTAHRPVPAKFTERGAPPKPIIVVVEGGNVQGVQNVPAGHAVAILDYDHGEGSDDDAENVFEDRDGDRYAVALYEGPGSTVGNAEVVAAYSDK